MTGWPGSDSPNFMDADHEGYISDQKRIAELEAALRATRAIVVEGALVGFNPHDGDWADRLFKNQGAITDLIGYTPADAT